MNPVYDRHGVTVHHGDCLDVLRELPDSSIDAVCTDPPYSLSFMQRDWDSHDTSADFQVWCTDWARECLRVLKPGGHLVAFGGTRTFHRLTCGIEDAGFEIRDGLSWLYGSGFPKSLDVSKAIDKVRDWTLVERLADEIKRARAEAGLSLKAIGQAMQDATDGQYGAWYYRGGHMFFETGRSLPSRPEWEHLRVALPILPEFAEVYEAAEREVIGQSAHKSGIGNATAGHYTVGGTVAEHVTLTAPATDAARQWHGWGTALKPAWEPIILARKPLSGTVAGNVVAHGTGALNIDGCRVGHTDDLSRYERSATSGYKTGGVYGDGEAALIDSAHTAGRWPTNVVLTHAITCTVDPVWCDPSCPVAELDKQSAPNMHGAGKARAAIREADSTGMFSLAGDGQRYGDTGGASRFFPVFRWEAKAPTSERPMVNGRAHPTVKPIALMRWLVRLITPPGGLVLDPFAGTGTTGQAARAEGMRALLIDADAEAIGWIKARLDARARQTETTTTAGPQMETLDLLDLLDGEAS